MTAEYRSYLAVNILSDERVITYRLLSRALKVHVNAAKQMLFEFHRQQNVKKPGTVHATYLIAGTKRNLDPASTSSNQLEGVEEPVQSSPFRSSPIPNIEEAIEDSPVLSITLVREENLEELRLEYERITSIHVYSLAPHPLKNLQVFSDAARETAEIDTDQDPLELAGTYGTIINKAAKRRAVRQFQSRMQPKTTTADARTSGMPSKQSEFEDTKTTSSPAVKLEANIAQPSKETQSKGFEERRNASSKPPLTKRDSSNIFKSFAKARPPSKQDSADSSAGASGNSAPPSGPEDEIMKDTSEAEEDDYVAPPQAVSKGLEDTAKNSRKEREAALRKMMDDDNNEEDENEEEDEESDIVMENQHPESSRDVATCQYAEETVQVSSGRRRGRRRVMKKKTIQDDEGYLVTREEPVWESFSEDEPLQAKSKPPSSLSSSFDKSKKGSSLAGQGSIMSFFGKK